MNDAMRRLAFYEETLKFHARLFLLSCKWNPTKIATPDRDEYAGIGLLIRDGEEPREVLTNVGR